MSEIVNKIKQSKLETVDLEKFLQGESVATLDISQFLFREMILREKDFREQLAEFDWDIFDDKWVAITCSTDAIIPPWAWMLVSAYIQPHAREIVYGGESDIRAALFKSKIDEFSWEEYRDKFVLLKGCSKVAVPESAYVEATKKLLPVAAKLMYGEACSNVPVYRKTRS